MSNDRYEEIRKALAMGPTRKPIPSFPGYEADEEGNIWSVETNWRGIGPRVLSSYADDHGYLRVRLTIATGKRVKKFIHALVCEAFHGPRPAGFEVRHLDGNRKNNKPSNLAWGTRSENAKDRVLHGTCKARENGALGANATKQKYDHLSVTLRCPVCNREFETRQWKIRAAQRRGRQHTCSPSCGRRLGAMKVNAVRAE
jgi:hypothetical protein